MTRQGNSWHLNSSPNCDVNRSHEETIQMETNNNLQVSVTLGFIALSLRLIKHPQNWNLFFFLQLSTHCKLIRFVLFLFHQLSVGDGLDSEATRDSPIIFFVGND